MVDIYFDVFYFINWAYIATYSRRFNRNYAGMGFTTLLGTTILQRITISSHLYNEYY